MLTINLTQTLNSQITLTVHPDDTMIHGKKRQW